MFVFKRALDGFAVIGKSLCIGFFFGKLLDFRGLPLINKLPFTRTMEETGLNVSMID